MSDERAGGAIATQSTAFEQPARPGTAPATPSAPPALRKPRAKKQTRLRAARVLLTQVVLVAPVGDDRTATLLIAFALPVITVAGLQIAVE